MNGEYIGFLLKHFEAAEETKQLDLCQLDMLIKYTNPLLDSDKIEFARTAVALGPRFHDCARWVLLDLLRCRTDEPYYSKALDLLVFDVYLDGLKDSETAVDVFREYGDDDCVDVALQFRMGYLLATGNRGVTKDLSKAKYWLNRAVKRINDIANIGLLNSQLEQGLNMGKIEMSELMLRTCIYYGVYNGWGMDDLLEALLFLDLPKECIEKSLKVKLS